VTQSVVLLMAITYVLLLFAIASYGDRRASKANAQRAKPYIYAFSIAIYCTSWTFFGSVGLASERGIEYLGIYIGPILVFTLGRRFLRRIARLSKSESLTSVADMLASRYGKSFGVASLATLIAVMAAVPYIAIQLKAISGSFELFTRYLGGSMASSEFIIADFSFLVAASLGVFAILFGTRHADATEHQNGLILAVAVESAVKLTAFIAVGIGVTFFLFGSLDDVITAVRDNEQAVAALTYRPSIATWSVLIMLSAFAIILLPRQFHVMFVENRDERELKTASWLFPLYLVLINLFVMPIALIGLAKLPEGTPADLFVLALPLSQGAQWLSLLTFVGGLSAATAMVIVSSVALSIMVSNHLVLPMILRRYAGKERTKDEDLPTTILNVRRIAISAIMLGAYFYYREAASNYRLASIGLISFAAIAQFAPAFIGGLIWRNANARGAMLGMGAGTIVWLYTLLFPTLAGASNSVVEIGLFGLSWLRPQQLFGFSADPLVHGVVWSIGINLVVFVAGSLSRHSTPLERIQATIFVPRDVVQMPNLRRMRTGVTVEDLKATTARYLGSERTERSFQTFEKRDGRTIALSAAADPSTIRFAEQLLASAVGSSSARLILSLLFQRNDQSSRNAYRLLDDASEALQQNRDLLQIALDQMEQGITVLDHGYRLTCWNRQFRRLFDLPDEFGQVGTPLSQIIRFLFERGDIAIGTERITIERLNKFGQPWQVELASSGRIVEIRSNPMPDGGIVATYTDITARVRADEALKKVNESLEQRVQARTAELSNVNVELAKAQSLAEEANLGKTRFLAAAGHDILQPLNAARLYSASLIEKLGKSENEAIVSNIESSLDSVETILSAVLDISRLDTGALKPTITIFELGALLKQVETDFAPLATKKGLELRVVKTSVFVKTDRNLLQRLIQNLVSNAIKYTRTGSIIVGVRRRKGSVELQIVDSGIGIAQDKTKLVFREFTRLQDGMREAEGLGLGLSIVDRISKVLKLPLTVSSRVNRGTTMKIAIGTVSRPKDHVETAIRQTGTPTVKLPALQLICVDNDPRILDSMTTLLTGWGCHVMPCLNGQSAMTQNKTPDAILADYHLDNESGLHVISQVRAKYGRELPAILITADRSNEVRQLAESIDIIVLNKPVKPAALRAALMRNRVGIAAE
jgi:Na+/proline symporter/signal transduction histidine kinase/CheY-like chemotaxis protein